MARDYKNMSVDPFASDAKDFERIRTVGLGGTEADFTAPSTTNFPTAAPTRYFMLDIPWRIDITDTGASRPIIVKDMTTAAVLTRVTGLPGANQYRVPIEADSDATNVIELNSSQSNNQIALDFYTYAGLLTADDFNTIDIKGTITADGKISGDGVDSTGIMNAFANTNSTSKDTGSFICDGGAGIEKDVYTGGLISSVGDISSGGDMAATDVMRAVNGFEGIHRDSSGTETAQSYKLKEMDLGNWNMYFSSTGAQTLVKSHGIASGLSKIIDVIVTIYNDTGGKASHFLSGFDATDKNVGSIEWNDTNITLNTADISRFDGSTYDDNIINRGQAWIIYKP